MPHNIVTERVSLTLRERSLDLKGRRVLVTDFRGSLQAEDLTLPPNCGGFGRIHHFRRNGDPGWPDNPLPIDPATRALGLEARDILEAQVFQNAACSWRCWYCFVDFSLLSAHPRHSAFKSADELLDLYLDEVGHPAVLDLSGGQPDLVPEWTLWFSEALRGRGLMETTYLWSDDNLSNDFLWRFLTKSEVERLAAVPNYGRVGCFKGFDERSFAFNTGASSDLFVTQFHLMRRLVDTGFDVYGYVTLTSPDDRQVARAIGSFVDRLQELVHPLFPLRTIPLQVKPFSPTRERMSSARHRALAVQEYAALAWGEELRARFSEQDRSRRIYEHRLVR